MRESLAHPGHGSTSKVNHIFIALFFEETACSGTACTAAADHHQFSVFWDFCVAFLKLGEGNQLSTFCVYLAVLSCLTHIDQEGTLLYAGQTLLWTHVFNHGFQHNKDRAHKQSVGYTASVMHLLDLRDELDQEAEPLSLYFDDFNALPLELSQIETGQYDLDRTLHFLVVCEVGQKSKLAVMYLQSDGISAEHLEGGILGLRKTIEREFTLPYSDLLFRQLLDHPRVRFVSRSGDVLVVRGHLSDRDVQDLN